MSRLGRVSVLQLRAVRGDRLQLVVAGAVRQCSYKRVIGRSHTVEKRISTHPHKPHATSQSVSVHAWPQVCSRRGFADRFFLLLLIRGTRSGTGTGFNFLAARIWWKESSAGTPPVLLFQWWWVHAYAPVAIAGLVLWLTARGHHITTRAP